MAGGRKVRTSATHPIEVNFLPVSTGLDIGLTFAPGKKGPSQYGAPWDRDLDADLETLRTRWQVTTLVTLMEGHEFTTVKIPTLLDSVKQHGMASVHFPIPDIGVPKSIDELDSLLGDIEARLVRGERVAIHCLGGIGRTGTIAACLLLRRGTPLVEATRIVQETRCAGFPEGREQGPFVKRYAEHLKVGQPVAPRSSPIVSPTKAGSSNSAGRSAGIGRPWVMFGPSANNQLSGALSVSQVSSLLGTIEQQVKASPSACFHMSAGGSATLTVKEGSYRAGRFETPTIGELRKRAAKDAQAARGQVRLSILYGDGPETDVGWLQASAPAGVLFQAASQFNCLEAPGASVTSVAHYTSDNTQGPRASVSAFPGTFLRHYFAPRSTGERFTQTSRDNINLLGDVLPDHIARVQSGYLTTQNISDLAAAADSLERAFELIRVGVHDDVEVAFGANWGGPVPDAPHHRIAQVFTSTVALGGYSSNGGGRGIDVVVRQLQRAAYLGTLLAAVELRKHTVVLTLIGGGVFGNPARAIWDAIHWAVDEARQYSASLDVLVNTRLNKIDDIDRERALASGGSIIPLSQQHSGWK
ncbi:MAG: cyclin-dependent kinase inhibitor 3 family protein [Kofleriaceae bacterium]